MYKLFAKNYKTFMKKKYYTKGRTYHVNELENLILLRCQFSPIDLQTIT